MFPPALFVRLGSALALTNGALVMASRLIKGMAQQWVVPRAMGRVHRGRRTPFVAIAFVRD